MSDMLEDFLDYLEDDYDVWMTPAHFETLLAEYGLMVVPIEDPTRLRYGVEDER